MTRCSNCASEVEDGAASCSWCGQALSSVSQLPTGLASPSVAARAERRPVSSVVGRLASSDAIAASGFTPGAILAGRYRIIGLIGRGGMGEVYRADDLKLGQPVALKFLPKHLSHDKERLERFFAEVRNARQVAHPNVCRVYDIGDVDGEHFLSMEYVDGEDLASLLKRIGRLPPDKALDLSRQLCAGLAAAHDRGILHRDLKPANVMVDGRGRARIMDFGLAVGAEGGGEDGSGTPAYMAPEQFSGKPATVRSDLYALGLVLYELSTGRRAFDAVTIAAYRKKHAEETPTRPSAVLPDFDPAVERVILRCIEKDPAQRPASAAKVAAALPGGDPLAAALAAGETPSPEMVAAAGKQDGIAPATARLLLLALAAALAVSIVLVPRANLAASVGVDKSPEVLRERAQQILGTVGLTRKPDDFAQVWDTNHAFLQWARGHGGLASGLDRDAIAYSYRQSPNPLVPNGGVNGPSPGPLVTELDPAPVEPGMAQVGLDPRGRLVRLEIVPAEHDAENAPAPETDWGILFREAGLDMNRFAPVEPRWTPRTYAAVRAAWEGPHPERPGVTMRVEAASYRGKPVSFRWLGPWSGSDREAPRFDPGFTVFSWILFVIIVGGWWLAWNNLRGGRGDRRGTLRLGIAVYLISIVIWLLGSHHLTGTNEVWNLIAGISNAAAMGVGIWFIYLALEPFARRRWPQMLISWTRALSGNWRDPLVGHDVLIGATLGVAMGLILGPARVLLPPLLHLPGPPPHPFDAEAPVNPFWSTAWLLGASLDTLIRALAMVFFLVLVRWIVRNEWIAGVLVGVIFTAQYIGDPAPAVTLPLAALSMGLLVFATVRFGLLAAVVADCCRRIYGYRIYTSDPSSWMFYAGAIAVVLLAILVWWATRTALAGEPLFGGLGQEEGPVAQSG
jgi:hypothetical protein